jgi:hypothetical protein
VDAFVRNFAKAAAPDIERARKSLQEPVEQMQKALSDNLEALTRMSLTNWNRLSTLDRLLPPPKLDDPDEDGS